MSDTSDSARSVGHAHHIDDALELRLFCIKSSICDSAMEHLWPILPRKFTHLPLDKMAAILQTIFSSAHSWMKSFVFW